MTPKTFERYAEIARNNIGPLLGSVILSKLKPEQISSAYAKALTHGRCGGGGLVPRSVHHMHRILRQALQQAVVWNALPRAPASSVKPPKIDANRLRPYRPRSRRSCWNGSGIAASTGQA